MCLFINPAGIGIINKLTIKISRQKPINCMMDNSVSNLCFMDIAWFWVINFEGVV